MTPQRSAKKVAPNRGIVIAYVNRQKGNSNNDWADDLSEQIEISLHNTQTSFAKATGKLQSPLLQSQKIMSQVIS